MHAPELYCLTFGAEPASGLGHGQRRAVQTQVGLGPGVSSPAPALRNGLTRGVLSLTCPRTPALSHDASPSSTPDPRPAVDSLKKSTPDPRKSNSGLDSQPRANPITTQMHTSGVQ